ncbi:hypothetical protein J4573_45250 [Actinomadura barringtoniae]|uniref:Uncharacterized protein n=1 Tax=Actinomadura barringtoniae TaxID=1427535 RepID=A0A939PKC5_9ACTN|nr:hypothetical protein [Actinomadura barringtoniae]MBO2454361.1 hypothetical protein [Actinomadura barringtoniae]
MTYTPSNPEASGADQPGRDSQANARLLPLSVWLCSDTTSSEGAAAPVAPATPSATTNNPATARGELCVQHRATVGRQLARHLISACTREGDVVAEAFTTSEATMLAAVESGRRGLALVPHFPLAQHIGARLRATLPQDLLRRAEMRPCRPDQMARGLADVAGQVGLIVAAPPPYEVGGRVPKQMGSRGCPACRADLWMLTTEQLGAFLVAAWQVLRPGGTLAIITTARHEGARLVDPAPRIVRQASLLGFRYVQHVIALRVPIEGDALVVQAIPTEIAQFRDAHSGVLPPPARVHADVLLLTRPRVRRGGEAR